jgi:hypothetical protein
MRKVLLSMVCVSLGCGAGGEEIEDVFTAKSDGVDERADIRVVGDLESGKTSAKIAYDKSVKYRALRFRASEGDEVEAWVRSANGDAMGWILDVDGRVLAKNDDAELDVTDARVTATIADGEVFYVVFREAGMERATFTVSLAGATPPAEPDPPAGPVLQVGEPSGPRDGFTMNDARVEGDALVVSVRFGGGCEEHDFALFWDGRVLESLPAQVNLTLTHDAHGDACEAFIGKELRFDISKLAPFAEDELILRLGDLRLSYRASSASGLIVGPPAGPQDGYRVEDLRIEGNVLKLTAIYGGGCEEHGFKLFWDGELLETAPAQATLVLAHDSNSDACEALKSSALEFDLGRLAEVARGKVVLTIEGGDEPVTVTFEPR